MPAKDAKGAEEMAKATNHSSLFGSANRQSAIGNRKWALVALLLAASGALAGPAEDYIDAQLKVVRSLEGRLELLADIADESAGRLVAGGGLYLAGEQGIVLELVTRAGGLCGAKMVQAGKPLPPLGANDVVFFSDYGAPKDAAADRWDALAKTGAMVLVFGNDRPLFREKLPANVRTVPVGIPYDSRLIALPSGERLIPAAAPAIAIAQWAYTAELIGACRRKGKQLAVYLSVHLDEGRKRFERTKGLLFEPDLKPEPVPREQYAREFLATTRASLEAIRRDETGDIRKAASWVREALAARRKVVRHLYGHLPPTEAGLPGDPTFFTETIRGPVGEEGAKWIRANLHEGDVYLLVGYQENEDAMAAAASAMGARTIFMTSLAPGPAQAKDPRHLYINPHWPATDAVLALPGYDVNACPVSGILGLTCYYAICAEVVGK